MISDLVELLATPRTTHAGDTAIRCGRCPWIQPLHTSRSAFSLKRTDACEKLPSSHCFVATSVLRPPRDRMAPRRLEAQYRAFPKSQIYPCRLPHSKVSGDMLSRHSASPSHACLEASSENVAVPLKCSVSMASWNRGFPDHSKLSSSTSA